MGPLGLRRSDPARSDTLTLHVADVRPAIIGLRRTRRLSMRSRDLRASTQCEDEEHSHEPHMPVHCATTGSIRLGSLFLTLAARGLTGLKVIRCPEGSVSLRWGGIRRGRSNACAVRSEWPVYGEK